ncbi:MAG: Ppx/GppA phosphatase family protein [Hyphomicrobiales bacterium]|nr:Ppx/GppA phosphatase family protein [Hyphomicrobiales bacterium]
MPEAKSNGSSNGKLNLESEEQAPLDGSPAPAETAGAPALRPPGLSEALQPLLEDYAPTPYPRDRRAPRAAPVYGALDLGTNNCRLIVVRPGLRGFTIIDTFSRIVRLGEGVSTTGAMSKVAMTRAIEALKVCADKMQRAGVNRSRLIATEACRSSANADEFLARVHAETGLRLEVISREVEARLAVAGCASLIDRDSDWGLVFDIGGGSSELIWLDLARAAKPAADTPAARLRLLASIVDWTSLPFGVVTLAERFGGRDVDETVYERMVDSLRETLTAFDARSNMSSRIAGKTVSLLGTSGTVTTIAGVHLGLPFYNRNKVDGVWLDAADVRAVTRALLRMGYEGRVLQPCIGPERADLVLAGCAILEAMLRLWPCERLRVADRGLREGILTTLMAEDGVGAVDARALGASRRFQS